MKNNELTSNSEFQPQTKGFTLVEMLLVLVILGLLAAIVYPRVTELGDRARYRAAVVQMGAFKTALESYEIENGNYPKGSRGLYGLAERPAAATNWRRYLDSVPQDPWKNDYLYDSPGAHNPDTYDLSSMGKDGRSGTEDDITNWQQR